MSGKHKLRTGALKRSVARLLCASLLFSAAVSPQAFAAGNFRTTLENLTPLGGQWEETSSGLHSAGSGDNFNLSQTTAKDFVYEATATFHQNKGAASLIFLSGDQPNQNSYCANIDKYRGNAGNARIFRFGGAEMEGRDLPESMKNQNTFTMRVEVTGSTIRYFVDDLLILSREEARTENGRLGLLTFDTEVTYQDVLHEDYTGKEIPALTNLTLDGLSLKKTFQSGLYTYGATIPYGQDSVTVKPFAPAGTSVQVWGNSSSGAVLEAQEKDGGFVVPTSEGSTDILIRVSRGDQSMTYVIRGEKAVDPETKYRDKYRPQFHFSPFKNWMNDPNGLVYDPSNGTYHLYYQYNPTGLNIGNQVWGHAESTDLINWTQMEEPAIVQDDGLGAIFSGCAVVDEDNTSGLFDDNKPGESKLVALFTHDGGDTSKGVEKQSLAYSKDHGHTWIKPSLEKEGFENPVIPNEGNKYGRDFRDPKVFRYDGKWMMVVAGGRARLFTSDDLIHWDEAADLGFDSECPDLFPLALDGDETNIKWVYTASGKWYIVGDLQKDGVKNGVQQYKFVRETGQLPYNGGPRVYATQSFYNDGSGQNRRMLVSWLQDESAGQLAADGKTWNGVQTVPYVTTLKTVNGQPRLISYPVEEVKKNRTELLVSMTDTSIDQNSANLLGGYGAQKFDLEAVFTPGTATEFGFKLRKGSGQEIVVKYDASSQKFILDQNKSGKVNTGVYSMDLTPTSDGKIKMRILVDTTVLEAFGNDGQAVNSVLYFPEPQSIGMELFTNGALKVDSLKIYGMKSIWYNEEQQQPDFQLLTADEVKLAVGDTLPVGAAILPSPQDKEVNWTVENSDVLETVSKDAYTVNVKALKPGTSKVKAILAGTDLTREVTVTVVEKYFYTNLTGWKYLSGNWYENELGLVTDGKSGGDVFAVSGQKAGEIEAYEADVTGNCASLLFGVTNPENPSAGTWFGANVDTTGGAVNAKLFQNSHNSEVWKESKEIPRADRYHLKVTVAKDKTIAYYVNDTLIGRHKADGYGEGYLGLLAFNGTASFNNVYLAGPKGVVKTALQELYNAHKDKQEWRYAQSGWDEFSKAMADAKALLEDENAAQAQVDAAAEALETAAEALKELPMGDVTGDGKLEQADIQAMRDFIMERKSPSERQLKIGDLDGDKVITVGDILKVRKLVGQENAKTKLSYTDVVSRMTDLEYLSTAAPAGEKSGESASYEKKSKYDEATGKYVDWAANTDNGYDTPRTEDGGYLAADLTGPGTIVRIWSAEPRQGHIKIYIDGEKTPAIDMPFIDLFGGGEAPFHLPELCYEAGRGKNCYVPITYNKSCKVVLYGDWGMYYHVNYVTYDKNTQVESFSMPASDQQIAALKKVNDYFASGIGTAPKTYEGENTVKKTVTVPAGGKVNLLDAKGSGAVTGIKVKVNGMQNPGDDWNALAEMTLSANWDGEKDPAVWSTLGGFFASITGTNEYASLPLGVNKDGTMYCYWYMPYEDGAVVAIGNDGAKDYEITYEINTAPLSKEEAAGKLRFHAKWNRAKDPQKTDRWPDSQFLYTTGTGRFVGTSLHIYKEIGTGDPAYEPNWWWGEGDEKFFVDGEKFPSWFGTGSEDYFGYAWGSWNTFSQAYHSQPFTNGGMFGIGSRLNNRFHIMDSVPFQESFDANLEKYHRDRYANWVFTNYWYLDKDGTDPYGPVSLKDRTSYYHHPYPEAASFMEGEDLSIIESTGMLQAETQDMSPFPADKWSGGAQFILKSQNAGDYVKFWINVPEAGEYELTARFTKAGDFGIAQHYVDGKAVGTSVDLYDPTVCRTGEIKLGKVSLTPGLHEFEARITGKNSASSGYFYGLDYLKVEK